jgi:hypothetical protein
MTTTLIQSHPPAGSSARFEFYNPTPKMALDTIKSKVHKTFPFTSPTITNNPPAQTVILEILFSSDNVNSSSASNTHGDEGVEEEDDNEGESDDEDDVSSNSDALSNVDSEDGSDEDDEEDEEGEEDEDEAVDEDSDEEDDDGEHEFDDGEDFANDFDNDLIIDFGNDDNDDEDQLVVFEDSTSPPASRKRSVSPPNPIPFWFTHEEPDQIRTIFKSYALTLDLEKQRKACIRSPAPFIGRIKRTPIKPAESDTDKEFKTLDKVEIYLRELYPLGTMLPLSRVAWVLTSWDDDGIPTNCSELSKSAKKSVQKRAQGALSSTLYCAPVFRTKDEYEFSVSSQEHSLMYTSSSSTNASICRISPFLPEHCRTISFSLD